MTIPDFDIEQNGTLTYADSDTNSDTDSVTNSVTLSEKQKVVLDFCRKPRNAREIMDRIGISYHSKNMKIYVKDLVLGGYLRLTIPDKPNSPAQKYVTTDYGLRNTTRSRRRAPARASPSSPSGRSSRPRAPPRQYSAWSGWRR